MTPQREEATRLLRLARRDQVALNALLGAPAVGVAVAFFHAQQAAEKALKAVTSWQMPVATQASKTAGCAC